MYIQKKFFILLLFLLALTSTHPCSAMHPAGSPDDTAPYGTEQDVRHRPLKRPRIESIDFTLDDIIQCMGSDASKQYRLETSPSTPLSDGAESFVSAMPPQRAYADLMSAARQPKYLLAAASAADPSETGMSAALDSPTYNTEVEWSFPIEPEMLIAFGEDMDTELPSPSATPSCTPRMTDQTRTSPQPTIDEPQVQLNTRIKKHPKRKEIWNQATLLALPAAKFVKQLGVSRRSFNRMLKELVKDKRQRLFCEKSLKIPKTRLLIALKYQTGRFTSNEIAEHSMELGTDHTYTGRGILLIAHKVRAATGRHIPR